MRLSVGDKRTRDSLCEEEYLKGLENKKKGGTRMNYIHDIFSINTEYFTSKGVQLLQDLIDAYMPFGILSPVYFKAARELLNGYPENESNFTEFQKIIPKAHVPFNKPAKEAMLNRLEELTDNVQHAIISEYPSDYICENYLQMKLKEIPSNAHEYTILNDFIMNTQHQNFETKFIVDSIFKIIKSKEMPTEQNRRMLVHVTYANNIIGILKEGLCVAPIHVRGSGRNDHGGGVYFSDTAAVPLRRFNDSTAEMVYLLFCTVELGNSFKKEDFHASYEGEDDSVIYRGSEFSDIPELLLSQNNFQTFKIEDNLNPPSNFTIQYNEYTLKNEQHCKVEYIVKTKKISNPNVVN